MKITINSIIHSLSFLTFLIVSFHVNGQEISYSTWKEESKTNIRLLPEYGNVPKTPEQKQADENFIQNTLRTDGTREKGSEHLVNLGFSYMYRGNLRIAMYRFNQAWILNPNNENAYWGFGGIYFYFKDYDAALKMYNKGLTINPKSSKILTDIATIYMAMLSDGFNKHYSDKALHFLMEAYQIDAHNTNTTYKLSTFYFAMNDCKNALRFYKECMADGGQPITEEYKKVINQTCH